QTSFNKFNALPEDTSEQIANKASVYSKLINGRQWYRLKQLSDIQAAQFFIPKTSQNKDTLTTNSSYLTFLNTNRAIQTRGAAVATGIGADKKFFHCFLEFPEVFQQGGFDCILGNPAFLGGQKFSGYYSANFLEYLKYMYRPLGALDLVTYFFRTIFDIINPSGFQSLLSTNTIAQGSAPEGG